MIFFQAALRVLPTTFDHWTFSIRVLSNFWTLLPKTISITSLADSPLEQPLGFSTRKHPWVFPWLMFIKGQHDPLTIFFPTDGDKYKVLPFKSRTLVELIFVTQVESMNISMDDDFLLKSSWICSWTWASEFNLFFPTGFVPEWFNGFTVELMVQ